MILSVSVYCDMLHLTFFNEVNLFLFLFFSQQSYTLFLKFQGRRQISFCYADDPYLDQQLLRFLFYCPRNLIAAQITL